MTNEKVTEFPARLHVLIPRKSKQALVIRRGPSKRTAVFSWNIKTHDFKEVQWLKGRIYEKRSDISPDGKHWIYFAMNGRWHDEAKGSWTAVAKAPFLKAVSLYAKGDCWYGGGLFTDNKSYWLNDDGGHQNVYSRHGSVKQNTQYKPPFNYGGESPHVYYNRLQRDGWLLASTHAVAKWHEKVIFTKKTANNWTLMKVCHQQLHSVPGKGSYWDEHILIKNDLQINLATWEWSDLINKHIVFASKGCLFQLPIETAENISSAQMLHDFNTYCYKPLKAPY